VSAQPTFSHFGRYRVIGEIGRGAMGVVYEAEDETLQRQVAVKTMLLSDDAEERIEHEARFRQEAKAAAGLNHPNVITVYDMGREGDWLYIAMEMLRGVELRELMNNGTLTLPVAVDLISQVASGLGAAHMRGIVHRDIKPSNIMVMGGRHAKIMDFGVARMQISEVKTQTGVMLGSPKYMAPEQVEGRRADSRSDIFSLGSVLYECVAGVAPFTGTDLGTLLFDIVRGEPAPPSVRNPAVPPELDRIVARALSKDPAARFQDADQMAHELAQCAAQLMAGAVRHGTFSPASGFGGLTASTFSGGVPASTFSGGMPASTLSGGVPATTFSGSVPASEAPTRPGAPAPSPPDDPERTVAQVRHRAPPAAYEATQVSAVPHVEPPSGPDTAADEAEQSRPAVGSGVRRASFPVAPEFDSIAALHRLAIGDVRDPPPPPPEPAPPGPPRWAWPVACGVAALVAVWIAFG
jgi:serine/threonine-protein kinase